MSNQREKTIATLKDFLDAPIDYSKEYTFESSTPLGNHIKSTYYKVIERPEECDLNRGKKSTTWLRIRTPNDEANGTLEIAAENHLGDRVYMVENLK